MVIHQYSCPAFCSCNKVGCCICCCHTRLPLLRFMLYYYAFLCLFALPFLSVPFSPLLAMSIKYFLFCCFEPLLPKCLYFLPRPVHLVCRHNWVFLVFVMPATDTFFFYTSFWYRPHMMCHYVYADIFLLMKIGYPGVKPPLHSFLEKSFPLCVALWLCVCSHVIGASVRAFIALLLWVCIDQQM